MPPATSRALPVRVEPSTIRVVDVLACPDCGGRLRPVAIIADPRVIARILAHLGLPVEPPGPVSPRGYWARARSGLRMRNPAPHCSRERAEQIVIYTPE